MVAIQREGPATSAVAACGMHARIPRWRLDVRATASLTTWRGITGVEEMFYSYDDRMVEARFSIERRCKDFFNTKNPCTFQLYMTAFEVRETRNNSTDTDF